MAINIRDLALLDFCHEQKFMTLIQIGEMFFPGKSKLFNWPMKCVRKLVKEGLLIAEKPGFCEHTLYRVSPEGVRLLRKHGLGNGLCAIKQIDTRTWEHDLWVTDVRIIFFRKFGLKRWKAERLLKQEREGKVPDGIVPFGNTDLVIEVERSLKKKDYYRKTLQNTCIWQFKEETILYLMADETDKRWLMKQAQGWVRIYFATITDLREMKDSVTFVNCEGEKFTLHRKEESLDDKSDEPAEPNEDEIA